MGIVYAPIENLGDLDGWFSDLGKTIGRTAKNVAASEQFATVAGVAGGAIGGVVGGPAGAAAGAAAARYGAQAAHNAVKKSRQKPNSFSPPTEQFQESLDASPAAAAGPLPGIGASLSTRALSTSSSLLSRNRFASMRAARPQSAIMARAGVAPAPAAASNRNLLIVGALVAAGGLYWYQQQQGGRR